ncbi:MAG: DUF63 family protein [Nanopusillaceae archaeon]
MNILDFIYKYFVYPVVNFQYQYNIYNTLVYGLVYIIGFLIFYEFFVKRKKVKIDKYFLISLIVLTLDFLFIRVLMDLSYIQKTFLLLTPLLEFWMILSFLSYFIIKNKKYYIYALSIVFILEVIIFYKNLSINILPFFLLIILLSTIIYLSINEKFFILSIFGELFETIFSIISIYLYNLSSEHVLLNFLVFQYSNPLLFYSLKMLLTFMISLYIKYKVEETDLKNTLYLSIFYLGFLPGLRAALIDILI